MRPELVPISRNARSSMRRQLIWTLVPGVVALIAAAGAGLYFYVEETLERSVDNAVAAKAEALAAMVRMEDDRQPHLRIPDQYATEFSSKGSPLFQIWRQDGSTLARSASLGAADVPQA